MDLDFPAHPAENAREPRYAVQADAWDRVACRPFLDAAHSPRLTRTLWIPGMHDRNSFGDYCLLRNKQREAARENLRAGTTIESQTVLL